MGYGCDPGQVIACSNLALWLAQGTNCVQIAVGDGPGLEDASGYFANLLQPGDILLVRPDRFCMAAFRAEEAGAMLQAAADLMGFHGRVGESG